MRPSFHPRLVNGPFDDPGLFIPFSFSKRAMIFDLGGMPGLSPRDKLKISHAFVTHTHMDHFIGLDDLVRLMLGRDKCLHLYGPEGFMRNVMGKLAGYSWNLVGNYDNRFVIKAFEILPGGLRCNTFECKNGFRPSSESLETPFTGTLLSEPALTVSAAQLDHGIPCLCFSISERFHININKEAVFDLGLDLGPWLNRFKEEIYVYGPSGRAFSAPMKGVAGEKEFTLEELAGAISIITPGQKAVYVADAAPSDENIRKIIDFASDADHLYIEAPFMESDRQTAVQKRHLTARLAGFIAGNSGAKQFTVFHFSPRYMGMEHLLYEEADAAFEETKTQASKF